MAEITEGVEAWLMPVERQVNVAVGRSEVVHLVNQPEYISVPQSPRHCNQVIIWNDNVVPVISIESLLFEYGNNIDSGVLAIVMFQVGHNQYCYGGIKLVSVPQLEKVQNSQACKLPASSERWNDISNACFQLNTGEVIPVLDLGKLFTRYFPEYVM